MGDQKNAETAFLAAIRDERKARGWSQADMTELLSTKGVFLADTGLTKIENGHRPVRINEAIAIADVFGVTVDALAGRKMDHDADFRYAVRAMTDATRQSVAQLDAMRVDLRTRERNLGPFDFMGREKLVADIAAAESALEAAQQKLEALSAFEIPADATVKLSLRLVAKGVREYADSLSGDGDATTADVLSAAKKRSN